MRCESNLGENSNLEKDLNKTETIIYKIKKRESKETFKKRKQKLWKDVLEFSEVRTR